MSRLLTMTADSGSLLQRVGSSLLLLIALLSVGTVGEAAETDTPPTSSLYQQHCAMCHEGGVPRAPHSVAFQMMGPAAIYDALTNGVMRTEASMLTPEQRRALAEELGGAVLPDAQTVAMPQCMGARARFDVDLPPRAADWGMGLGNARYVDAATAGLSAREVPSLKLKWAFAFPGASRARSQPAAAGGAAFVGSQDGTVYALDLATGCVRWKFKATTEVRNSPSIEPWRKGDPQARPRAFFGDIAGNLYAIDAFSGQEIWRVRADEHPYTTITGSPRLFEGRVYVPLSSSEWAAAADPGYECCTFRGGVAAFDARDGRLVWRSYAIAETPKPTGEHTSAGTARRGPAGAPVWNSPTIDPKRRRIYVGTGEGYTSPAVDTSDAVLAFDLDTGAILWHYQSISRDAWNMACFISNGPNCPEENGPDHDIGAPPILASLKNGHEVLLAGQKSGHVFALDPDDGRLLWRERPGRGGFIGGVHWGMAFDGNTLFVPMADTTLTGTEPGEPRPGLHALDPVTGAVRWYTRNYDICLPSTKPACDAGLSAPATAIPGVVFAGALDGHLRAYDAATGEILWQDNTVREYYTVNGVPGQGGGFSAAGPLVIDGHVVVNSGYLFGGRMPGNVLLVYSVDGR